MNIEEIKKAFEQKFYTEIAPSINPNAEPPYNAPQKVDVFWSKPSEVWIWIESLLQQEREKAVREVVSFLDELEIRQPDHVKTDNWRWWKYIRNNIRDQFLKESEGQDDNK